MRMRQVCEQTGLTDRAVRLYIESGLLQPLEEQGYSGRRSFHFSDADIETLKVVSTLRKADFSIADIREMQQFPERIPAILERQKKKLAGEIDNKKRILHTLEKHDCFAVLDYSFLAERLGGSTSSNILPKEDSMMRLKDVQRTVRKRIPSVLAFALLVLGCTVLLPVFIRTAFADVKLLGRGEFLYEYVFSWENFFACFPLFPAWLALAIAAILMLFHIVKGERRYSLLGVALCIFSVVSLLFLSEETRSVLYEFEFLSYRHSLLWNVLSGESEAMDLFVQSLKFLPASFSAILALLGVFWNKETESK